MAIRFKDLSTCCANCPFHKSVLGVEITKMSALLVCDNEQSDHHGHILIAGHQMCVLGIKATQD
jgi:hypothetical protein